MLSLNHLDQCSNPHVKGPTNLTDKLSQQQFHRYSIYRLIQNIISLYKKSIVVFGGGRWGGGCVVVCGGVAGGYH